MWCFIHELIAIWLLYAFAFSELRARSWLYSIIRYSFLYILGPVCSGYSYMNSYLSLVWSFIAKSRFFRRGQRGLLRLQHKSISIIHGCIDLCQSLHYPNIKIISPDCIISHVTLGWDFFLNYSRFSLFITLYGFQCLGVWFSLHKVLADILFSQDLLLSLEQH